MKRERGVLRTSANLAKQRLASGFWKTGTNEEIMAIKHRLSREDEEFYARVKSLLVVGVINPLSHMIDKEYLSTISNKDKERYIFNLSEKIRDCIKRYNNEKERLPAVNY
ncbi:MAG: hypothetical protein FWE16_01200 [Firmicutes bacterium]|nr:hypothetical protein [Bacillota bacterium]